MIIEFIGMPASGKTTLAKKLYDRGELCGIPIRYPLKTLYEQSWAVRNLKKILSAAWFALSHMACAGRVLRALIHTKQSGFADIVKLFFNNMFFMAQRSGAQDHAIFIFDEGAFHYAWALLARAKNPPNVDEMLTLYPMPDALICVETPPGELRCRYEKRKARGDATGRHDDIMNNIDVLSARVAELTTRAKARGIPVLKLQNDAQRREGDNASELVAFVKRLIL